MTIKKLRESNGMTWLHFAKLLGVSVSTVARWESGKCRPSIKVFARIERVFGKEAAINLMKEYFKEE
jgi:transcriptional regulator with XRE-family HTH domain